MIIFVHRLYQVAHLYCKLEMKWVEVVLEINIAYMTEKNHNIISQRPSLHTTAKNIY